jgi:hypothetical protein
MSSSTTCVCACEHNLLWQVLEIVTGALVATVGVQAWGLGYCAAFPCSAVFWVGALLLSAGAGCCLLALCVPRCVIKYMRFLITFFGRSMLYLALGFLVYSPSSGYATGFVAALFCWFTAVLYFVLNFVRGCGSPRPFFILDGSTGTYWQRSTRTTYSQQY